MTIHALAELYMLTDKSPDFIATQEFIDRRIADFREFEKFSAYFGGFLRSGLVVKNSLLDILKEPIIDAETEKM